MRNFDHDEYRSLILSCFPVLLCTFALGEIVGFRYGYHGALAVEGLATSNITFAVHGTSYLSPMIIGYLVGLICCAIFILLVWGSRDLIPARLITVAIGTVALLRGLFYKYLVLSKTGEPGFLNPYADWIPQAVVKDCVCIAALGALFWFQTRSRFLTSKDI